MGFKCLSLRGNQRTSGELARKEGGKIFGSGSRTPIAITILVRKPNHAGNAEIRYEAVEDYLSREEKLAFVKERKSILSPQMRLSSIAPNEAGDWINQRDGLFETFIPLECEGKFNRESKSVFVVNSRGLETARDSWVYNSSKTSLLGNTKRMVAFYNSQVEAFKARTDRNVKAKDFISYSASKISWSSNLVDAVQREISIAFQPEAISVGMYRPFFKQYIYRGEKFINRRGQFDQFFPTPQSGNVIICVPGVGCSKQFMPFIVDTIPDVQLQFNGQCFPLYWYERTDRSQMSLFDKGDGGYVRRSAISDFILKRAREQYGPKTTAEDVFHYVYGLLHSEDYRKRFTADLQKSLPRIPLVDDVAAFRAFVAAGRKLAALHLSYETAEPCESLIVSGRDAAPVVRQMKFAKKDGEADRSVIVFNDAIKIENVPLRAYEWVVNGKSPIEWLMERYAVTVNKDSQIRNDPNDWCRELGNPRYVLDLIGRIVTVSLKTLDVVASLPKLKWPS